MKLHVASHLSANIKHQTKWLIICSVSQTANLCNKNNGSKMAMNPQTQKSYMYLQLLKLISIFLSLLMQSVAFGHGKCFANNTICVVFKQRHEKWSLLWVGKTQIIYKHLCK